MNLHDLNTEARAGHVEELNLIAIEGGITCLRHAYMGAPTRCLIHEASACACTLWKRRAGSCRGCQTCR